jgi:hypothetical protein
VSQIFRQVSIFGLRTEGFSIFQLTNSDPLRGWGSLSNEAHGFSVGEVFSQMGKKLLTKGIASAVP